jgi:membrane protease YdiL (CAAX protease family)
MNVNLKKQPAWLQLVIFGLCTLGIALIGSFIGFGVLASIHHISLLQMTRLTTADFAKPEYVSLAKGLLVVQFFTIFLIPSLLFAWLADPHPFQFAGLKMPDRLSYIVVGVVIILFAYILVEWLGELNQWLVKTVFGKSAQAWIEKGESDVDGTLQNILNMKNAQDLWVSILLVGVLAAVGEELFFRGILQRILIQAFKSPWIGIVVTGAIFSAIHGQFLGFIPRMILGIILGALYWYSGSLFPAMVGHFVFNSLQVVLLYYKKIDSNDPHSGLADKMIPLLGVIALVVIIALLNYLRKRSATTYEKVYAISLPTDGFPE